MSPPTHDVTALLALAQDAANQSARDELYRRIETELRQIARARLREQPHLHSWCTTELIHEAWQRLMGRAAADGSHHWVNRRHFFAATSKVIHNLLVDHYRRLADRPKHLDSGLLQNLPDHDGVTPAEEVEQAERFLALDQALDRLDERDPNAAEVCRLRCFGTLIPKLFGQESPTKLAKLQDLANTLELPLSTVHSRWQRAVLFLSQQLQEFVVP